MHAIHRTAPVPRPRVGERAAGAAAMSIEPFDWAVEEPDWVIDESDWATAECTPAAAAPDWWERDRPILATPTTPATPATHTSAHSHPEDDGAGRVSRRRAGEMAGRGGERGVRLTRRGRLVVVALAAAMLLGAFWVGTRAVSAASTTAGTEVAYVQNGDTLWAVAERVRPGTDPRDTVARIRDLNGLEGTLVQPGQRLILPAR